MAPILYNNRAISGSIPEIDELFPPRPPPNKRTQPEGVPQSRHVPTATGAGFFTPDTGNAGNLFRGWRPEPPAPQPFRIGSARPRDSM
jgi:anaphase-promoting complex subunit 3